MGPPNSMHYAMAMTTPISFGIFGSFGNSEIEKHEIMPLVVIDNVPIDLMEKSGQEFWAAKKTPTKSEEFSGATKFNNSHPRIASKRWWKPIIFLQKKNDSYVSFRWCFWEWGFLFLTPLSFCFPDSWVSLTPHIRHEDPNKGSSPNLGSCNGILVVIVGPLKEGHT